MSERSISWFLGQILIFIIIAASLKELAKEAANFISSNIWTISTVILIIGLGVYMIFYTDEKSKSDERDKPNDYF